MAAVRDKQLDLEDARRRLEQAGAFAPPPQAHTIQTVWDAYWISDAAHRNALLHSVLERITYHKEKKTKPAEFQLVFTLKPH